MTLKISTSPRLKEGQKKNSAFEQNGNVAPAERESTKNKKKSINSSSKFIAVTAFSKTKTKKIINREK